MWAIAVCLLAACWGCRSPRAGDQVRLKGGLDFEDLRHEKPCTRLGCFATATIGTTFQDPEKLGAHSYQFNMAEKNGIVYTCMGGHIDLAHLRNVADWTAYLASVTYEELQDGQTDFSFRLGEEINGYVEIEYPAGWSDISDDTRDMILFDVSTGLGQYCAYQSSIWHEIVTWFGYKCTGIYPEFGSSFSWEDTFSNLLGCHIGYLALYDRRHGYNEAVTLTLQQELEKLDAQPAKTARLASQLVRGDWYTGETPIVFMKGRNLDTGLDDGYVTPWVVGGLCDCRDEQAVSYVVPSLAFLEQYGFKATFEIEPKVWEKDKIFRIVFPDGKKTKRFDLSEKMAVIMDHIEKQADGKYKVQAGNETIVSKKQTDSSRGG